MSGSDKRVLAPWLRFPEFREAGEWTEKKLGEIGHFSGGGTPSKEKAHYWTGCNPWVSSSDISEEDIRVIKISRFISDEAIRESATKQVLKNSILLVSRVGVGKLAITDKPIYTSQDFTNFTPANDNVVFLAYLLKSLRNIFLSFNQGMAIKGFTKDDASNVKISLPTQREQQKIADCLSSLDELIAAETQKLDALRVYKKGLMQQLFPREGETVPRLRFPEFREAGAWATVTAGQLFSNRIERGESKLPIYAVTITEGLVPRASLDRRIEDIAESSANKTARRGDIAYNMMRMWQGALGVAPEDCMVSPAYIVLEPQTGVNPVFYYFLLKLPEMLQVLTAHSRGLTEDRLRLYYDDFVKVTLPCPSPSEQKRTADCLSSLDDLITTQSQKINALKTHKKGLMQQLFPVMDETQQ
jgi:type I restriction enzyme S subunit